MIQIEYAHMQGNSGGNFIDYWDAINAHPKLQGGFIWDWVDQSMYGHTSDGRSYWATGGEYGPNPGGDIEFGDGMIQPDRTPNPHFYEVQKVYGPIAFEATNGVHGEVTVINRHDFRDLSGFAIEWELAADGVVIGSGAGPELATPAGASEIIRLPVDPLMGRRGVEYLLTMRARARRGAIAGVPEGHVVAWDQMPIGPREQTPRAVPSGKVTAVESGSAVRVTASNAVLTIDKASGLIASYSVRGQERIAGGAPNFHRALIDNDIGGGLEKSHAVWKTMSETRKLRSLRTSRAPNGPVEVVVEHELGDGAVLFRTGYRIFGDGSVQVTGAFEPRKQDLPDPLRIGFAYRMPQQVSMVQWYGRGPHETYQDRRTSGAIALWRGRIADQNHDYMRPQETGNKVDVRWMELSEPGAGGLRVEGDAPLSMNALAFPYEDLDRRPPGTRRSSDIVPRSHVSLLVDAEQSGVGGDNTWSVEGRALPKYRVDLAPRTFSFTISPFEGPGTQVGAAKPASATKEE
jgi:beta-galactosidase